MAAPRQLKTPPIVEAVIDFRVRLGKPLSGPDVLDLSNGFKKQFPKPSMIRARAFELAITENPEDNQANVADTFSGLRFDNEELGQVAVFQNERFTFSQVKN